MRVTKILSLLGGVFARSPVLYKKGASLKYNIRQADGHKHGVDEGRVVVSLAS